jgi:NTE family protein
VSKKVHLVLGSGGAHGIAHIAVIEKLEKAGYEIIEVIGCSMGL